MNEKIEIRILMEMQKFSLEGIFPKSIHTHWKKPARLGGMKVHLFNAGI